MSVADGRRSPAESILASIGTIISQMTTATGMARVMTSIFLTESNCMSLASRPEPLARPGESAMIPIMKSGDAIAALGALASEARLAVFRLLVKRGPDGYTPSELTRRLDVPSPTLSFHLRELVNAGLVTSRREGRNLFYSPNVGRVRDLVGFLTDSCCALAERACGPDCQPIAGAAHRVPEAVKHRKRA